MKDFINFRLEKKLKKKGKLGMDVHDEIFAMETKSPLKRSALKKEPNFEVDAPPEEAPLETSESIDVYFELRP